MVYAHTSHNRTVCASPLKRLGFRKTPVGLRPLWRFAPPHFCGCWKPAVSLIATAKTSHTAGTLYEIWAEIIERLKIIEIMENG